MELATKTYLTLESINRFLLEQPSLVNTSRRQLFPVVLQRQQLADSLARYMTMLGLKRRNKAIRAWASTWPDVVRVVLPSTAPGRRATSAPVRVS